MLSGLFGKNEEETTHLFKDRAYMTTAAKMKACALLAKGDEAYIFLAWFNDTAKKFRTFFTEKGISENRVIEVSQLQPAQLHTHKPVFLEHYPMHVKEEELVKNWEAKDIMVYSAMDEPLFKHFGSEKILPMMKMLGMKEDEVIEHSMVSKSIRKGQESIAAKVSSEQLASSQAEWMHKNMA